MTSKVAQTLLVMVGFAIFAVVISPFIPNLIWIVVGSIVALFIFVMVVKMINKNTQEVYE